VCSIARLGVKARCTRAIADRAGVAYPSLYRFFADREEILDRLLERHVEDLNELELAAEGSWEPTSVEDLINRQLDLHAAYYREHPSAARLWLSGRSSPTVLAHVREHLRELAERMREMLITRQLIPADTDPRALSLLVELGDRTLDLAFREGPAPDPVIIDLGRRALAACLRGF